MYMQDLFQADQLIIVECIALFVPCATAGVPESKATSSGDRQAQPETVLPGK